MTDAEIIRNKSSIFSSDYLSNDFTQFWLIVFA